MLTVAPLPAGALNALLPDMRMHLRLDTFDEDALVASYLGAALIHAEERTGQLYARREVTWRRDGLRALATPLRLPRLPVVSVTSITYLDDAGAAQTLAADQYQLVAPYGETLGRIEPVYGVAWPSARSVTVTYLAGHESVPQPVRQAVFLLAAHWYEHREAVNVGNIVTKMDFAVDALLAPYRIPVL